jgi:hypothetical protein
MILAMALLAVVHANAQINAYAKVTGITGNTLTVSDVNETFHTFETGQKVIVMQMQNASITGYTTNNTNFGTIASIGSTGLYEIATLANVAESAGLPVSLTLSAPLRNTYVPGEALQVITYRQLGTTHFTTTANMSALPWNGSVGGVLAFWVNGNLTLRHNIDANGDGFRGGLTQGSDGSGCNATAFRAAPTGAYANKGEGVRFGVYGTTNLHAAARGRHTNGGGGGNTHNAGGAGGGNITAGGDGGPGYGCTSSAGGIGGASLSSYANSSRIFMGGGAGAGQQNNAASSNGGNGGGILLIAADTLIVDGTCTGRSITANGTNAANTSGSGNDGAGGGGAGGSIVLSFRGVRVQSPCPLNISANGGSGGSVNSTSAHGGGGGGGQGAVYTSFPSIIPNINVTTVSGAGGLNSTSSTVRAGTGTGITGSGVVPNVTNSPLPVVMLYLRGIKLTFQNKIEWATSQETNAAYYEVYRSTDGENWWLMDERQAAGNSDMTVHYFVIDPSPANGYNYYRVKQVDRDGTYAWFTTIVLDNSRETINRLQAYPNPLYPNATLWVTLPEAGVPDAITMVNVHGQETALRFDQTDPNHVSLVPGHWPAGTYVLKIQLGAKLYTHRFVMTEK